MAMITGSWGSVVLVCGNHPESEEAPEMVLCSGPHSLFYACPKHDPLNREDDEKPCFNRINLIDYEKMLEHISNEIVEADEKGETLCLLNHKWKRKSMQFQVIEHTSDLIKIKFVDTVAIQGRRV